MSEKSSVCVMHKNMLPTINHQKTSVKVVTINKWAFPDCNVCNVNNVMSICINRHKLFPRSSSIAIIVFFANEEGSVLAISVFMGRGVN